MYRIMPVSTFLIMIRFFSYEQTNFLIIDKCNFLIKLHKFYFIYSFYITENKAVGVMKLGHCFTIEPMISQGTWKDETWPDNWTAVTLDGQWSAQFENTLLVTETGCDILTKRLANNGRPWFMEHL